MYEFLRDLDRRVIFSLMALAVAVPILLQITPPESDSDRSRCLRDHRSSGRGRPGVHGLRLRPRQCGGIAAHGDRLRRHACEKKLKIYFTALWPVGPQFIKNAEQDVISRDFPDMVYGEDYVDLGFKTGNEGVIKLVANDLRTQYPKMPGAHPSMTFP